jgi:hypothetical protein
MMEIMPDLENSDPRAPIPLEDFRATFNVDWDDDLPVEPVIGREIVTTYIYESDVFARFDPLKHPDRLSKGVYTAVYGDFLQTCDDIIQSADVIKERL